MIKIPRRRVRSHALLTVAAAAVAASVTTPVFAQITIDQISNTDWKISNGDLNIVFDPTTNNIPSIAIGGSGNVLDPKNSQLYPEFAGTPFGSGSQSFGYQNTGQYIDFWSTTASTGTTANPITYSFHYVMFPNDPNILCYEVLNHSATDPATSVGQGQFLARVNPTLFYNSYQTNVSPNNPGAQTSVIQNPYDFPTATGTFVQDATNDLTGSGIPGAWGSNFYTKYDYASYYQFLQANTEYGPQYSVSAIYTSMDTSNGGPTHQGLQFTNNIAMIEFLSGHEGDANYAYVPPQGVNSTRLFGPYDFQFVDTGTQTGAQLNTTAVDSMPQLLSEFNNDNVLIDNGYVQVQDRGSLSISAGNSAGWSANTTDNTLVLSDPDTDYQESKEGYQYWTQLSAGGTGTINNIVPGTYEMTLYELGQWGETVVQNVQVQGGKVTIPQNLKFTPENFSASAPVWTIGTPDRSDHEFLNGSNVSVSFVNHNAVGTPITNNGVTPGGDLRQYQGNYNYWYEEQQLGTPGYVQYYATAVGSTPATNNPLDWIANQWGEFNPGIYDPANDTTGGYAAGYGPNGGAPAYVTAAGGPANYKGSAWLVNFTTTQAQLNQGQYVDLSVGLASNEASLIVTLNGHQEIWHYGGNNTDAMVRSADSGVYEFLVFEFPTSDLNAAGTLDQFTFGVSQNDGDMYDALRMEISPTGANPSVTGWHDYYYITGANSQTSPNFSLGLSLTNSMSGQASAWGSSSGGSWGMSDNWLSSSIPGLAGTTANFTGAITTASTVNLNSNWTVGSVIFDNANSYTLSGGGGTLVLNNGANAAVITDAGGSHFISAPVALANNLLVTVANSGDNLTISGPISGPGGVTLAGAGTFTLLAANSYAGNTSVNSGLLVAGVNGALPVNSGLTIGTLSSNGTVRLALNTKTTALSSVTINNGSTLDITNNALAINYGSPANDPIAALAAALANGYAGGAWTGTGFISSTAQNSGGAILSVGYADGNTDADTPAGPNQVLVKYTLAGDANLDGLVNSADLLVVVQNFDKTGTDWAHGNFTYITSGPSTTSDDLLLIVQNFNGMLTPPGSSSDELGGGIIPLGQAAGIEPAAVRVPEPAEISLLAVGAGFFAARRRRRANQRV